MAVVATRTAGPFDGPDGRTIVFNVPLKAAWTGAGETLDLTDHFQYIYKAEIQTVTSADALDIQMNLVLPSPATAITATNVSVVCKRDLGVDTGPGGFSDCNAVDLSGVVLSRLVVTGKRKVDSSW